MKKFTVNWMVSEAAIEGEVIMVYRNGERCNGKYTPSQFVRSYKPSDLGSRLPEQYATIEKIERHGHI